MLHQHRFPSSISSQQYCNTSEQYQSVMKNNEIRLKILPMSCFPHPPASVFSCCKLFSPALLCPFLLPPHLKKALTCPPKGSSEHRVPHNQTWVPGSLNIPLCHRGVALVLQQEKDCPFNICRFLKKNSPGNQLTQISCLSVPECIRISALLLFGIPLSWKAASDHCQKYGPWAPFFYR